LLISLIMGAKPEGDTSTPTFLPGEGGTLMFLYPQLLHDTKSIFCHQVQLFYFFFHLKLVIANLEWTKGEGEHVSQHFRQRDTDASPKFCMTQSQSSVIKFSSFIFLSPEVSDNKPGVDEWNKPPKNLVAFLQ